ncbi:hypothetical protein HDA40_001817 [Hamadaea flava]|nr:hypothetical protein [Hamadaea flava]
MARIHETSALAVVEASFAAALAADRQLHGSARWPQLA